MFVLGNLKIKILSNVYINHAARSFYINYLRQSEKVLRFVVGVSAP